MTVSEETAQEQIERFERSISKLESRLENRDTATESISRLHGLIANKLRNIGMYKLLLGDKNQAKEKFKEATQHELQKHQNKLKYEKEANNQAHWVEQSSTLEGVLYTALLTEDDEVIQQAVDEVEKLSSDYKTTYPKTVYGYYHVKALANVAIGSASQEEYIDALRESVTDEDAHLQRYFGAVATVLDGIRTGGEESVEDGLVTLLDRHAEKREGKSGSLRDRVSRRPLALLLLARKHGLDIDIDSQYIPDTVL